MTLPWVPPGTSMYWYVIFRVFISSTQVRDSETGTASSMSP